MNDEESAVAGLFVGERIEEYVAR